MDEEIEFVKRPEDDDRTKAVLSAIDERTAITALPHCFWIDGTRLNLSQIGWRCREIGSALVIDATQSLGTVPFEVREVQPDFPILSAYKWLLCPYTLGFLYVVPQHQDGVPLEHSWRGGYMVGLRLVDRGMGERTKDLQSRFTDQKIYLSVRRDVIRFAPHLSVNETDIDHLISLNFGDCRRGRLQVDDGSGQFSCRQQLR